MNCHGSIREINQFCTLCKRKKLVNTPQQSFLKSSVLTLFITIWLPRGSSFNTTRINLRTVSCFVFFNETYFLFSFQLINCGIEEEVVLVSTPGCFQCDNLDATGYRDACWGCFQWTCVWTLWHPIAPMYAESRVLREILERGDLLHIACGSYAKFNN